MSTREHEETYPTYSVKRIVDEQGRLVRIEKHNEGFFTVAWRSPASLSQFLTYIEEYFEKVDPELSKELVVTIFKDDTEQEPGTCSTGPEQWDAVRPLSPQDFTDIGAESPDFVRVDTQAGAFTFSPSEHEIGFLSTANPMEPMKDAIRNTIFRSSGSSPIHFADITRLLDWATPKSIPVPAASPQS